MILLVVVIAAVAQVHGAGINDYYIEELKKVASAVRTIVPEVQKYLETEDYTIDYQGNQFLTYGQAIISDRKMNLTIEYHEMVNNATAGGEPSQLITCLNDQYDKGTKNLTALKAPTDNKVRAILSLALAANVASRAKLQNYDRQIDEIYIPYAEKLDNVDECLIDACVIPTLVEGENKLLELNINVNNEYVVVTMTRRNYDNQFFDYRDELIVDADATLENALYMLQNCWENYE